MMGGIDDVGEGGVEMFVSHERGYGLLLYLFLGSSPYSNLVIVAVLGVVDY